MRNLGVFEGQYVWKHFDDGYLRAEGIKNIGELDPDRARADDHSRSRKLIQSDSLLRTDDSLPVEGKTRQRTGNTACGNENIRRRELFLPAVDEFNVHLTRLLQRGLAAQRCNLVLLKEEVHAG